MSGPGESDAAARWARHRADFRWSVPARFNIGLDICRHAAGPDRPAVIAAEADGTTRVTGFHALDRQSSRFSNLLRVEGFLPGDRLAILLPQSAEVAIGHLGAFKAGVVSVPLFVLFGAEALLYRLADSGARGVLTDMEGLARLLPLLGQLPALERIWVTGAGFVPAPGIAWEAALAQASPHGEHVPTGADDPALMIYTSGTTGNPKGALHAHRVLLGHLPGVELPHDFFPQPGDLMWSPADWAWIGGLLDVLLPSLHHGVPVLAHRARKFDPEAAYALMARHAVRNVFMPPTALRLLRAAGPPPAGVALRSIASGGETLGAELLEWAKAGFGLTLHEFYGQTECNLVAGNASRLYPVRPGSLGKPYPGHRVAIVDAEGNELPVGEAGQVGVARPDPVMFLGYWNNSRATAAKFANGWLLTGDTARQDEDGYLWFVGRDDDVITSAGYRIGPGEVEDCLARHPAVAVAAVIGVPDPVRTELVKAWVVLRDGFAPSAALAAELQGFVRERLAAHEYPRAVEFVDALPVTATGKIQRGVLRRMERERAAGAAARGHDPAT
ncbi:acyl-CoA synthetase [Roseomonas sp. NAR14]|uniref:Acyl-CoA synthetase n=1 Tax=Roseomonas acroporae TaxID=2937791 RepID=A0A9X2BVH8_9PROT|nr:acyl-CoA synthetase [Roseomonas acroporae]